MVFQMALSHLTSHDLEWSNQNKHGGVTEADHREYLDDFAADFITAMQAKIDDVAKRAKHVTLADDDVAMECMAHARCVAEKKEGFFEREKELKLIRAYVTDSQATGALVVKGILGSGRSAFVAKAASLVQYFVMIFVTKYVGLSCVSCNFCR